MELSIIRRETTGAGESAMLFLGNFALGLTLPSDNADSLEPAPNQYNESETITKFEIMDGAPVRGESLVSSQDLDCLADVDGASPATQARRSRSGSSSAALNSRRRSGTSTRSSRRGITSTWSSSTRRTDGISSASLPQTSSFQLCVPIYLVGVLTDFCFDGLCNQAARDYVVPESGRSAGPSRCAVRPASRARNAARDTGDRALGAAAAAALCGATSRRQPTRSSDRSCWSRTGRRGVPRCIT
jgi:hypothetical protein